MATDTDSTKDEVARLHKEGKSAKEIADAVGKTPATVYNHLRNLGLGHGKRGRPKGSGGTKSEGSTTKSTPKTEAVKPRPRPGSKPSPQAKVEASTNGHSADGTAARFPKVKEAIEAELTEARRQVATLEGMLEAFVS